MPDIIVKSGRVRPLWAGHPWVFAQAIDRITGAPRAGDAVRVLDPKGGFLGRGFYSPNSALRVRIASRDPEEDLGPGWLARRIDEAAKLRSELGFPSETDTGYRLVNAEGDGLPGLIVDVYGDTATVLFGTVGTWRLRQDVYGHVQRVSGASVVVALEARREAQEGFVQERETVRGAEAGALRFRERGFDIEIPESVTQKTGYYFDQRENRSRLESLAEGRRVLDAFAFIGTFGLYACRGGARDVLSLDRSATATAAGAVVSHRAGFDETHRFTTGDCKRAMPALARDGERFDMVVVDPPKLVPSRRDLERGKRAYRAVNRNAMALLRPGGLLVSCSCSAALLEKDFVRVVAAAAADAGRELTLIHMGHQALDHPVPAAFPEGRYLKTAFMRVS